MMRKTAADGTPDLVLLVNSNEYSGWYDQSFSRSMEDLCGKFSLSVYHDSRDEKKLFKKISKGDKCEVVLASRKLMTGWVNGSNPFYSRTDIGRKIEGRDLSADVVDSSAVHAGGEWNNVKIDRIVSDLCAPRGVKVVVAPGTDLGAAFSTFRIETGEKTGETIARAASYRGLMIYSLADGNLIISHVNKGRASAVIRGGVNKIITAEQVGGEQDLFHKYSIEGQGDANEFGEGATSLSGVTYDPAVRKTRELIIPADTGSDSQSYKKRSECCVKQRRARAEHYVYTMEGWFQEDGTPWDINMRIDVDDEQMDLTMAEMVIAALDYKVDRKEGKVITLTLKSPDAFDDKPVPQPESDE